MGTFHDLITSGKPVLVDFYADWCGPCKMMGPILKQVAEEIGENATIVKVDIDKNEAAAAHYHITGVPTLMIFKDGEIKWRESGVLPANELVKLLQKFAA